MKSGELLERTGVSIRSLRYYEEQRLLTPLRLENGYREYSPLAVDCDESPAAASQYGVMSMPTVIAFHHGEPVDKLVGLRPKSVYENVIGKYASLSV